MIEIVHGRHQRKAIRCHQCGHHRFSYEEKETDVNIAVSLVSDAASGKVDAALLLSADSDLAPAVRSARQLNPAMFITAVFPPKRQSVELTKLMPKSMYLGINRIRAAQLPETVIGAAGKSWTRPAYWR
ncbi:NYN domain [Mycobacteroides abscessus subsp. abscessus]|nr:NYN domain [Mycobacteroides abscessus subsp. abscessus]